MENPDWPALPYAEWAPTKKTVHLVAQMLGKTKLALAPPEPQWHHVRLFLDARGLATGAVPCGSRTLSAGIDLFAATVWLAASDGRTATVQLGHGRTVADIWAEYRGALGTLGVGADLWDKPQEVADVTPFSQNEHDGAFVAEHARRFHRALCSIDGVFGQFRSGFFGRGGVQFWWGGFDLTVLLFNGRPAPAQDDRGYIMRYDLDAEHLNAGFWAGDDSAQSPAFYGYLVPRPPGCETAPIVPRYAGWVEKLGEWLMPYDEVRACPDPGRTILDFLGSVYGVATTVGGWEAAAHEYVPPPAPARH